MPRRKWAGLIERLEAGEEISPDIARIAAALFRHHFERRLKEIEDHGRDAGTKSVSDAAV